jgi:hypothetical protein
MRTGQGKTLAAVMPTALARPRRHRRELGRERFHPVAPKKLAWQMTIDDPGTWSCPWTFTMPLTRHDSQQVFEYACHEVNRGLLHILTDARADDTRR